MATFSQGFLNALTRPSFGQGLFQLGQGIGQAPGMFTQQQKQEEQLSKLKTMTPVQRAQYQIDNAKTEKELLTAQQALQSAQAFEREDLMNKGGESINAMVNMLITEKDPKRIDMIEKGIREVAGRSGRNVAAIENQLVNIDRQKTTEAREQEYDTFFNKYVPEDRREEYRGLTKAQILAKLDADRDVNKARDWANWRVENEITNENRQEAIDLAVEVFGSRAAEEVANLETKQINAKINGRKKKVRVAYQGQGDPFLGTPGKIQTKDEEITLDENGQVPKRFIDLWEDTATSVIGVDFDYSWSPTPVALTTPSPSPVQPTGPFLTPRQLREQQGK